MKQEHLKQKRQYYFFSRLHGSGMLTVTVTKIWIDKKSHPKPVTVARVTVDAVEGKSLYTPGMTFIVEQEEWQYGLFLPAWDNHLAITCAFNT